MTKEAIEFAAEVVTQRIGVAVQPKWIDEIDGSLELAPVDLHPHDSFIVRFTPKWRTAEAAFEPGKFAAPLISQMGNAGPDNRSAFLAFAAALDKRKARLLFRVNGIDCTSLNPSQWATDWRQLELIVRSAPLVVNQADMEQMKQLVVDLVVPLFGMLVALIGVEEDESAVPGEPEGRAVQTLTTRYERKKVNREACIQLKGLQCAACGFNFEAVYGELGIGYVEIHHIIPVSQLGPDYRIDVMTDLEPLCANCHAMVHRKDPPISIAEMREIASRRLAR